MVKIVFSGLNHNTTNFLESIRFYEELLGLKAKRCYENRWAEFEEFGLMNINYDYERIDSGEFRKHVSDNYLEFLQEEQLTNRKGFIASFQTDNIQEAYQLVLRMKKPPKTITEIMKVNFSIPFLFFQCEDPSGNILEIFQFG